MTSFTKMKELVECLIQYGLDETICLQLKKVISDSNYYFRTHFKHSLRYEDQCKDHCLHYALSDIKDVDFQQICNHSHDIICFHCGNLRKIIGNFILQLFLVKGISTYVLRLKSFICNCNSNQESLYLSN